MISISQIKARQKPVKLRVTSEIKEAWSQSGSKAIDFYRDPEVDLLTERELEVLVEVAHRLSNQEIGNKLFISLPTVKTHVAHILQKIKARDRVQAVVFAYENQLV